MELSVLGNSCLNRACFIDWLDVRYDGTDMVPPWSADRAVRAAAARTEIDSVWTDHCCPPAQCCVVRRARDGSCLVTVSQKAKLYKKPD